ncbi:3-hydroxyacyl-ACP dehydratase FabZ [Sinomonas sp. ASV486]|uniref:3-hydroxyacyl-ACP dehydratase FabZ n=1 Tax=Sinomonas sp. ASV486 TaxID=3051170 RepID=UPI0027DB8032|nr:3-hydroxyacyl-ACP dehydratase FabZ [Sinomonas sp. ASV486]MDQ4492204.1 3-hydroxyacyl-ACP dehydratase FabZ [Sinomonas sp. ASV486]
MSEALISARTTQTIAHFYPHRHPFLLVDRIEEAGPDQAVGIKAVTATEPWFTGHFPERPVLPGVILLEAMAQVGRFLKPLDRELLSSRLARIDAVKFLREAVPGDVVRMVATSEGELGDVSKYKVVASVDDEPCASAQFTVHSVLAPVAGTPAGARA